jgi:hypothetical protein
MEVLRVTRRGHFVHVCAALAVAGLLAITAKQATARRKRFMGASLGEGPNNRTILNRLYCDKSQ